MRAVTESEIQDDHTWLTAFMGEAWKNYPAESAAGIAHSIDKIWDSVNDLYSAAEVPDADADALWTLPIFGGRPVAYSADAAPSDPPLGILDPPEVVQTAGFLAGVCFDELWAIAGAGLVRPGGDAAMVEQEFLDHHRRLQRFFARAAASGHTVVRAVWA